MEEEEILNTITPEEEEFRQKVFEDFLNERKIIINDVIDEKVIERVVMQILKFNHEDKDKSSEKRKPIWLHLNSPGGSVQAGFNLINTIQNSKTPVYGVCHQAYSMATYVLIVCQKRYAYRNSTILFHDGETTLSSTSSKVKDTMAWIEELEKRLDGLVFEKTNIQEEQYTENRRKEWYLFGDEAKKYGIVDYLIGIDIEQDEIC